MNAVGGALGAVIATKIGATRGMCGYGIVLPNTMRSLSAKTSLATWVSATNGVTVCGPRVIKRPASAGQPSHSSRRRSTHEARVECPHYHTITYHYRPHRHHFSTLFTIITFISATPLVAWEAMVGRRSDKVIVWLRGETDMWRKAVKLIR